MALQRAKASSISAKLGGSASRSAPRVSSENTTPQPKVASGALRSTTVTWWAGSARLASSAKYSPAGPPPRTPIRIAAPRSGEHVGQPVELGGVGHGRQQHQVVAAGLLVAADEVPDRAAAGQVAGRDPLGERAGEGVVVAQVGAAGVGVAEGEVALGPELRAAGPLEVAPGRPGLGGGVGERPRRPPPLGVARGGAGPPRQRPPPQA